MTNKQLKADAKEIRKLMKVLRVKKKQFSLNKDAYYKEHTPVKLNDIIKVDLRRKKGGAPMKGHFIINNILADESYSKANSLFKEEVFVSKNFMANKINHNTFNITEDYKLSIRIKDNIIYFAFTRPAKSKFTYSQRLNFDEATEASTIEKIGKVFKGLPYMYTKEEREK